jgi:hypothetical protein
LYNSRQVVSGMATSSSIEKAEEVGRTEKIFTLLLRVVKGQNGQFLHRHLSRIGAAMSIRLRLKQEVEFIFRGIRT